MEPGSSRKKPDKRTNGLSTPQRKVRRKQHQRAYSKRHGRVYIREEQYKRWLSVRDRDGVKSDTELVITFTGQRLAYVSICLLSFSLLSVLLLDPGTTNHYLVWKSVRSDVRSIFNLTESYRSDESWISVGDNSSFCQPKGNIVFIKTHKTGSTSFRNILNRYGLSNNLSFLLSKEKSRAGHFSSSSSVYPADLLPPIGVEEGDYKNYIFNISNVHMRPDWKELRQLMNPSSIYITLLRHPVDQWLSSFQYFHHDRRSKPFSRFELDPVRAFLRFPAKIKFFSADICNQQFRDMEVWMTYGELDDDEFIRRKIEDYSKLFSLVLLTEYFDESLILLKRLLCWQFDDILYLKMREQPSPLEADSDTKAEIEQLNRADMMLYDHFNKTLWKMIDAYGPEFDDDLKYFRNYLNSVQEECVGEKEVLIVAGNHENVRYNVRNKTEMCTTIVNYRYSSEIIRRQKKSRGKEKRLS